MGDDVAFGVANLCVSFDGGATYRPISGEVTSFDVDADELAYPSLKEDEQGSIELRMPWYWTNTLLVGVLLGESAALVQWLRPRYTVWGLRRGGKSHRGKELR